MSDNKTPISIVLGIIEKKYDESPCNDDYECGYCNALNEVIQTLKSHLALEEEAIKEAFDNGVKDCEDGIIPLYLSGQQYFNQTFKPE